MLRTMLIVAACVAGLAPLAAGCSAHGAPIPPPPTAPGPYAAHPCGWRRDPPATYQHVLWIFFENRSYRQIVGSRQAPYLNSLIRSCGLATAFHNETHPSLPDYLAAVSGSTAGVTRDCSPAACPQSGPTLFQQVAATGRAWRVYAESMPGTCRRTDSGAYAVRHTAAPYYPGLAHCRQWQVPLGTATSGAFHDALTSGRLPAFALVIPDLCNDMHDCPTRRGDRWLAAWLPRILASPAYGTGRTAVFITWDEGSGGYSGQDCLRRGADAGCHVATIVVSPSTPPGTRSATTFSHYAMLRTTEEMLGISGYLGHAATAASMRPAFRL